MLIKIVIKIGRVKANCDLFSTSVRVNTIQNADLFSRHFMYSFFFLRHSRAASRFFRSRISRFLDNGHHQVLHGLNFLGTFLNFFTILAFTTLYHHHNNGKFTRLISISITINLTGLICWTRRQDCLGRKSPGKTWTRGRRMGCTVLVIVVMLFYGDGGGYGIDLLFDS